ncbi:MAG: SWIM zinc finger domain-containing protein [Roseburia sp.]|nr:SWIM zinc finger domain-containing protein [Roseburia sp.]
MALDKHEETWENTWSQKTHETDYALKRIKSAQTAKLTPVEINSEDGCGYFQGGSGRYETFLDYCPCGDFLRSKLPCKHIYRLAAELGLMDIDVKHNVNSIPTPKSERLKLDEIIDLVEALSADAQHALRDIAGNVTSAKPYTPITSSNDGIAELFNSGIIVDFDPDNHKINFGTKKEIAALLDTENITYRKNDKKSVLENLCIEHMPEKAREKFGEIIDVSIPTKFSSQKIHYYLHRKLDYKIHYDENWNFSKTPFLETDLPDDDITNQLIKRGYYNRK